jgi:CheY-like chemotaxis protein
VERRLCILVVDDEFDVAELLAELLAARGHKVTTAINGLLARDVLARTDFDLLITDFMMPLVDGIELVQGMRKDPRLARMPVIMISAQGDLPAVVKRELVQATLQKPFSPAALYDAIAGVHPSHDPE